MNIKVNLISKARRIKKKKNLIVSGTIAFFFIFCGTFLASVMYTTYNVYFLNKQISAITLESISVSSTIRSNNENVNKYVLSKGILDYVSGIESSKFHYKKYLDEIVLVLSSNAVLRTVDFQVKGWVSASVSVPDLASFRDFEERIFDKTILDQTVFASVFSEGVSKDKNGGYVIKLEFELKKNV